MFDFEALEKAQAAIDTIRDPGRKQRVLDDARLRVGAVQQSHVAPGHAVAGQRLHLLSNPVRLIAVGLRLIHAKRFAMAGRGPEIFPQAFAVM